MDQHNSFLFFRICRARNERRFYHLYLQPNLFGGVDLMRENGRIGSAGMVRARHFECEEDAMLEMCKVARRKIMRGYRHVGALSRTGLPQPAIFEAWDHGAALDDRVTRALLNRNSYAAALALEDLSRKASEDAHLAPIAGVLARFAGRLDAARPL